MPDTLAPAVTDVVELTRTLVRCESVTPKEAGALQHLERTLKPLGFACERVRCHGDRINGDVGD